MSDDELAGGHAEPEKKPGLIRRKLSDLDERVKQRNKARADEKAMTRDAYEQGRREGLLKGAKERGRREGREAGMRKPGLMGALDRLGGSGQKKGGKGLRYDDTLFNRDLLDTGPKGKGDRGPSALERDLMGSGSKRKRDDPYSF